MFLIGGDLPFLRQRLSVKFSEQRAQPATAIAVVPPAMMMINDGCQEEKARAVANSKLLEVPKSEE